MLTEFAEHTHSSWSRRLPSPNPSLQPNASKGETTASGRPLLRRSVPLGLPAFCCFLSSWATLPDSADRQRPSRKFVRHLHCLPSWPGQAWTWLDKATPPPESPCPGSILASELCLSFLGLPRFSLRSPGRSVQGSGMLASPCWGCARQQEKKKACLRCDGRVMHSCPTGPDGDAARRLPCSFRVYLVHVYDVRAMSCCSSSCTYPQVRLWQRTDVSLAPQARQTRQRMIIPPPPPPSPFPFDPPRLHSLHSLVAS